MDFKTLEWIGGIDGCLEMIDQRILPEKYEKLQCRDIDTLYSAIQSLAVRGAPAIGVAAAYGICIACREYTQNSVTGLISHINERADYLAASRPTAVNLFWALERMKSKARQILNDDTRISIKDFKRLLLDEANLICVEDQQMCRAIGLNGKHLIHNDTTVLTHCNAGALATAGIGTALAPMYCANTDGVKFRVYVDETRPLLQGARLTAWELTRAGIDATLICDNMAGMLMKQGKVDAVITGADRIAANGDAANKIGTYSLSILAAHHNIPFYIAAPSSTFDLSLSSGDKIPIEQRNAKEVAGFGPVPTAPGKIKVYNPAFDVVDAVKITAIITEKGVIEKPDTEKIAAHLA